MVGSNRAVGYSYYDNVTAQQLGKTFPYIVTSGVLKDVVARDLQVGAVTSQIEASVMENTNLFTIRVKDSSPDTAYRVLQSVITNYPEVAEYIIGATTLTVVDDSGVPVSRSTARMRYMPECRSSGGTCRCTAFGLHLCENKKNNSPGR